MSQINFVAEKINQNFSQFEQSKKIKRLSRVSQKISRKSAKFQSIIQ